MSVSEAINNLGAFLIGFEESQAICLELRKLGIEAYSCDLKECSGGHPEWHLQMDIYEAIDSRDWTFIGLHPTCTKMTLSGNRHYAPGKSRHSERLDAVEWTIGVYQYACNKARFVFMENPMGAMNTDTRLPKPQVIQPYYFGDEAQKTTCLWLYNLPTLIHNRLPSLFGEDITHVGRGKMWVAKSGKVLPEWYAKTPSTNNEANRAIRSKTFPGIAKAIAIQWAGYIQQQLSK